MQNGRAARKMFSLRFVILRIAQIHEIKIHAFGLRAAQLLAAEVGLADVTGAQWLRMRNPGNEEFFFCLTLSQTRFSEWALRRKSHGAQQVRE
ncbi:MAG: hypothetical protein H0T11_01725 [Chthoniobacterales bacterium]|nr:hypothetical protein [Chthoniobacterales bacterium]